MWESSVLGVRNVAGGGERSGGDYYEPRDVTHSVVMQSFFESNQSSRGGFIFGFATLIGFIELIFSTFGGASNVETLK